MEAEDMEVHVTCRRAPFEPPPHTEVLLRQALRELVNHHRRRRQRHGLGDLGHHLVRVRHVVRIVVLVRGRVGLGGKVCEVIS